ncbi:MAG: hypothetical protein ABSA53_08710 [Streptosporangiaceae bacterium]|jgi:hypothetical protein
MITEFDLDLGDGHTLHAYDAVSVSRLAPHGVPDLDWFGGINDSGIASLDAGAAGP